MYNHQLDAFIKAADYGSFTKASQALFITPAALAQQVNLLEKHIGAVLLNRTRRGVSLTPAGAVVYNAAVRIKRLSSETIESVAGMTSDSENVIRINRIPTTKYRYLKKYIHLMQAKCPSVRIEYVGFSDQQHPVFKANELIDFSEGVFFDAPLAGYGFIKLLDSPLCVALSEKHPLRGRVAIDPSELSISPIYMIPEGVSSQMDTLRSLFTMNGVQILDAPYMYTEDIFQICREKGYGLICPAIWQDLHPDIQVHMLTTTVLIPYGIAYFEPLSPVAQRFLNLIKKDNQPL